MTVAVGLVPAGTLSSTTPSPDAGAEPALSGPFQEDQKLPVNSKQLDPNAKAQAIDKQIQHIDKALKSKHLSPKRREDLERQRAELNAKRLSIPTDATPAP
jgi:hypothetical protein